MPDDLSTLRARYDAVVVGGGHNGLTAAAYLARAGRSVLVLERLDHVGGAAVSERPFPGVDARLSRYSYLVSLLPRQIVEELALPITLRRRRYSSYTPVGDGGLLVDTASAEATRASFPSAAEHDAWQRFYAMTGEVARRVAPTLTSPLLSRDEFRSLVGSGEAWTALFERPVGSVVRSTFEDDVVRGVVATDALIGTFAAVDEPSLRQNRCFLYHVIGNGTGDWDVPVGGMGVVSGALRDAAVAAGAVIVTGATVTAIDPASGEVAFTSRDGASRAVGAGHVLAGCAPSTLAGLLGTNPAESPEGAQLKLNLLLTRLPRLRSDVDPAAAFSGTFHVNESLTQLETAYAQAAGGAVPELPPCEIYCHSLTDPSILGPSLREAGAHTITLFGLHLPARLFRSDNDGAREAAVKATLASLNSVLAEPIEDCLALDADGRPCLDARTPVDLEASVGLPGGHIFHRDLSWPFAESPDEVGRWGVETEHPRVLLCGAGARRGGGVSGIPGRAAAMAVLGV
ncbi:phytoene desaturase family protein [Jiangella anatolica]|uniref:FAD-dependent oxidoreductase n=1 Tax=Jiangella anatolica TaxID=2670374 RepID=A0A2W2C2J6_9ACTN|nr:NAD(P)/FAD-dependent oxidoreductase [Jiangella anatolica]PZF79976.1 FAD-dependent oxidoreductase [Jiangella anatolica]